MTSRVANKAVCTDAPASEVRKNIAAIMDDVWRSISFGVGRKNAEPVDHALFDDFSGKAILIVEFECARLHHHGARFLTWPVGFGNETALHIPAD